MGLLWGWLIGLLTRRVSRPLLTLLLVPVITLPVAIEIWWFLGWAPLIPAAGAGGLALALHLVWRSRRCRHSSPPSNGATHDP